MKTLATSCFALVFPLWMIADEALARPISFSVEELRAVPDSNNRRIAGLTAEGKAFHALVDRHAPEILRMRAEHDTQPARVAAENEQEKVLIDRQESLNNAIRELVQGAPPALPVTATSTTDANEVQEIQRITHAHAVAALTFLAPQLVDALSANSGKVGRPIGETTVTYPFDDGEYLSVSVETGDGRNRVSSIAISLQADNFPQLNSPDDQMLTRIAQDGYMSIFGHRDLQEPRISGSGTGRYLCWRDAWRGWRLPEELTHAFYYSQGGSRRYVSWLAPMPQAEYDALMARLDKFPMRTDARGAAVAAIRQLPAGIEAAMSADGKRMASVSLHLAEATAPHAGSGIDREATFFIDKEAIAERATPGIVIPTWRVTLQLAPPLFQLVVDIAPEDGRVLHIHCYKWAW